MIKRRPRSQTAQDISSPTPHALPPTTTPKLFGILAHDTRFEVFVALVRQPRDVQTLVADLGLDQPVLSMHLASLRSKGLVEACPAGKHRIYGTGKRTLITRSDEGIKIEFAGDEGIGITITIPAAVEAKFAKWDAAAARALSWRRLGGPAARLDTMTPYPSPTRPTRGPEDGMSVAGGRSA